MIVSSTITPDIVRLLESVVWGTEGARYRLAEIEMTLQYLPRPQFLSLVENHELQALRLVLEKTCDHHARPLACAYHSFFAVDPKHLGEGWGRRLAEHTVSYLESRLPARSLVYSHVEEDNARSLAVHEKLGYRRLGSFQTVCFNRVWPLVWWEPHKLAESEVPLMIHLLDTFYGTHSLLDFSLSLDRSRYYVIREDHSIVAGLQVFPQRWTIEDLGGFGGKTAVKVLPKIPFVRSVFNANDFKFLKVGNVFYRRGRAELIFKLLESVLAWHGLKTAVMFWDPSSPVYRTLAESGRFGFLDALTQTHVAVLGRFRGFSDEEIERFCERPKVISPIDL